MPRSPPRLHLDAPLVAGRRHALDDARAHQLRHVLRLGEGDPVRPFNAADGEWDAVVRFDNRRGAALEIVARYRPPVPPDPHAPVLLFAPLKRDATDLAVRAATELGVGALRPVLTGRTVAGRVNVERLALIAREAAEQCERLDVPPVDAPAPLVAVLDTWRDGPIAVALERADARPLGFNGAPTGGGPPGDDTRRFAALLIGPEGGWTDDERARLGRHPACVPVSLGPLVLRAETAAIAGLALLRSEHGRPMHRPMPAPAGANPIGRNDVEPG